MPSKRAKLVAQAQARTRTVRSREQVQRDLAKPPGRRPLHHKVIAASLYTPQVEWLTDTLGALRRAGVTKPNFSEVLRVAVDDLRDRLDAKGPEEIRDYIAKRSTAPGENRSAL